jgi:hypothetical protein
VSIILSALVFHGRYSIPRCGQSGTERRAYKKLRSK